MKKLELPQGVKYLVIEGNIGAGKTSLATRLAADFNGRLVLEEFAENSFLPRFYEDPARFAFPLEMSFLAARFRQLTAAIARDPGRPLVSDYHFRKSLLFATNNLTGDELELYQSFFEMVNSKLPEPDLVIFLDSNTARLQQNIHKRLREYEQNISDEYLNAIAKGYENLIASGAFDRLLRVNSHELDFINNDSDYLFIINQLKSFH